MSSDQRIFLHDVSSPLTSLQLNLENAIMMLEDKKPEEIDECLKILNSCMGQVRRIVTMVRDRREVLIKESE